jgi:hypothetical protein
VRKAVLVGGGAVLLALVAAGQFAWPWSGPTINVQSDEPAGPRGPVTIEADALHKAYQDNPDAAAERFDGREMVVSGEFLRIVPDGYGSLDLRLKTSNPDEQLGVDVAQLAIEDAKRLRPGQRVTVSCQGMGEGGDELWVKDLRDSVRGRCRPRAFGDIRARRRSRRTRLGAHFSSVPAMLHLGDIESTVRHLGVDVENAPKLAEATEV